MRGVTWLVAALMMASAAHAAGSNRIMLVQTDRGRFYRYGALIPPPYEVTVSFHMEGPDTVCDQIYVNDYPLLAPLAPHAPNAVDSLLKARDAAFKAAWERKHVPPGPMTLKRAQAVAATYASLDTMVDSARAVSANGIVVYWRGSTEPSHMEFDDRRMPTKAQQARNFLFLANDSYARPLRFGEAVLFRGGVGVVPPALLDFELALARSGSPGPYQLLKDPVLRDEFLHPQPLPPQER